MAAITRASADSRLYFVFAARWGERSLLLCLQIFSGLVGDVVWNVAGVIFSVYISLMCSSRDVGN